METAVPVEFDGHASSVWPMTNTYVQAAQLNNFASPEALAGYLLYNPMHVAVEDVKDALPQSVKWLPSTRFGNGQAGPVRQYETMVIGKMPGETETAKERNFAGRSGDMMFDAAVSVGLDIEDWYCSNVVRFWPPDGGGTLKNHHIRDCSFLLGQDIAMAKPRNVLLVGADAVKAVFGKKATLTRVRSKLFLLKGVGGLGKVPMTLDGDEHMADAGVRIMATIHPAAVLRESGLFDGFKRDMEAFKSITEGRYGFEQPGAGCSYHYMSSLVEVRTLVDWLVETGQLTLGIDCEWGGASYLTGTLRTIQLCWAAKQSAVIMLCRAGGKEAQPVHETIQIRAELERLLSHPKTKLIGHNIRADAKWLQEIYPRVMEKVSFDTMLADHILNENSEHNLEACAIRFTDMGRYDFPVQEWLKKNAVGAMSVKKRGYLDVPDDVLHLYSACDPDATYRLEAPLSRMLADPKNLGPALCYRDVVLPCMLPIHEIETTGLLVDRERMLSLVKLYSKKKFELWATLRILVGKETFNPRSYPQIVTLLYDDPPYGLGMTPYKTTEKPARMWEDLLRMDPEEVYRVNPSTDSESLEHLAAEYKDNEVIKVLRDFKIIDQVTKSFLREPVDINEEGEEVYDSGLVGQIDPDERIRTDINQMSETGRWKSSKPNLHNLPKKQDKETGRIMGEGIHTIRSCVISPKRRVIIEADYRSAEIFTLGYLSNCMQLVEDAKGDLHARGAVTRMGAPRWDGFDQGVKPDKLWKKKYEAIRVASKTVSFGIPYQRGPKAIAREIEKATKGAVQCDTDRARSFIDGFYDQYAEVYQYVEMCKECVQYGFLENPHGRRRRAHVSRMTDRSTLAALEREFVNFPIQSTVADVLNVAAYNLWAWRRLNPGLCDYKILLAIHDAFLLEVPGNEVETVVERVLPECMKYGSVVPSWHPVPGWIPTVPFTLDIDIDVGVRWGEEATKDELRAARVPEHLITKFAH